MSTKVYTAYRLVRRSEFWHVVEKVKRQGEENAKSVLRDMITRLSDHINPDTERFRKGMASWNNERAVRLQLAGELVQRMYRRQSTSHARNAFNFDVELAFHEHKTGIYCIPYCDWTMEKVLDFLDDMPQLEDFAYWNNTDAPDGMPYREWNRRGRIWSAICDAGWGKRMVEIHIVDYAHYWMIDPTLEMVGEELKGKIA